MNAHARRFLVSASLFISFISFLTPAFAFAQTPQAPSPGCTITATPSSIIVGGSVTLRWTSTNATAGTITHIGNVPLSGSLNILPSSAQQTTFTGTFVGLGGTATCSTLVTVTSGSGSVGIGGASNGGGAYGTSGGNADPSQNYQTSQTTYSPTSYTVNPANFQTQPTSNTFSQTPTTVASPTSNNTVASFLVPCGLSSNNSFVNTDPNDATGCNLCYFGQLIQNIINFLVILSIPLSAGLFAWAGLLLFTSGANPTGKAKAKKIFYNVIIGLVIALSGYLIVQTLMNTLLNSSLSGGGWSWNSLQCTGVRPRTSPVSAIFQNLFNPTGAGVTSAGGSTGTNAPSQVGIGDCSPSGATMSAFGAQSAVMSCIAQAESSCNPSNNTGDHGLSIGLFQINVSANTVTCNGQTLNCPQAYAFPYKGGAVPGVVNQQLATQCVTAMQNPTCNAQTAQNLLATPKGLTNWSTYTNGTCH